MPASLPTLPSSFTLSVDWVVLALVAAGCALAWRLSHALAGALERWGARSNAPLVSDPPPLSARLRFHETLAWAATALLLALLALSTSAVIAAGQAGTMTLAGLLAIAATPPLVILIEGVQFPRARRLAERAANDASPKSLPLNAQPASRRRAA
jgi:hypothetical protein